MNTSDTIRAFITHQILHESLAIPLDDDDQSAESGIIDPSGVMTLLSLLGEEFSINTPDQELTPENSATLSTINTLVGNPRSG